MSKEICRLEGGHNLFLLEYRLSAEKQQILSYIDIDITCLKELHVTKKMIRTHRV